MFLPGQPTCKTHTPYNWPIPSRTSPAPCRRSVPVTAQQTRPPCMPWFIPLTRGSVEAGQTPKSTALAPPGSRPHFFIPNNSVLPFRFPPLVLLDYTPSQDVLEIQAVCVSCSSTNSLNRSTTRPSPSAISASPGWPSRSVCTFISDLRADAFWP